VFWKKMIGLRGNGDVRGKKGESTLGGYGKEERLEKERCANSKKWCRWGEGQVVKELRKNRPEGKERGRGQPENRSCENGAEK